MLQRPAAAVFGILALLSLLFLQHEAVAVGTPTTTTNLATIGIGSCNRHYDDQSFWKTIGSTLSSISNNNHHKSNDEKVPDAFVWLGDIIYGDDFNWPVWEPNDFPVIHNRFMELRNNTHYSNFVANDVRHVLGVWDDHDMGRNDVGKHFEHKEKMQQTFLDFFDVAADSPRRTEQRGVYSLTKLPFSSASASTTDEDGAATTEHKDRFEHAMCIVLLDVRYSRDDPNVNRTGDILGEEQWSWLEYILSNDLSDTKQQQLNGKQACLTTIIGSGVQVIPDTFPIEHWGRFKDSRSRLFHTIFTRHHLQRAMLISGDVHFGEILRDDRPSVVESIVGYPVLELTSSGLTHSCGDSYIKPDQEVECWFDFLFLPESRVGEGYYLHNFGSVELRSKQQNNEASQQGVGDNNKDALLANTEIVLRLHAVEEQGAVVRELAVPLNKLMGTPHSLSATSQALLPYPDQARPMFERLVRDIVQKHLIPSWSVDSLMFAIMYSFVLSCEFVTLVILGRGLWWGVRSILQSRRTKNDTAKKKEKSNPEIGSATATRGTKKKRQ